MAPSPAMIAVDRKSSRPFSRATLSMYGARSASDSSIRASGIHATPGTSRWCDSNRMITNAASTPHKVTRCRRRRRCISTPTSVSCPAPRSSATNLIAASVMPAFATTTPVAQIHTSNPYTPMSAGCSARAIRIEATSPSRYST